VCQAVKRPCILGDCQHAKLNTRPSSLCLHRLEIQSSKRLQQTCPAQHVS
jgi:hypothetical protein